MPTHLPPEELLAEYASGAASPGISLLVAAHLTQAPESRARVREFEEIGGSMMAEEDAADMAVDALDAVFAKLDAAPAEEKPSLTNGISAGPLPKPVVDRIGVNFNEIPWRFQLPGVSALDLDGFGDEKVTILRAKPGAKVPQHTHEAPEFTLILQGELADGGVVYRKGDVALNDEDDDHRPEVVGDETCYCLIVRQGDLRFTGRFSRILNYLGE